MFVRGIKTFASIYRLQYPLNLTLQSLPLRMGLVITAFRSGEMGSRDMVRAMGELAERRPEVWEMASRMAESTKGGASALREYREEGENSVTNAPRCWTTPPQASHDAYFDYEEIVEGRSMVAAATKIDGTDEEISVVYRLTNRPTYPPHVAALMWQFPGCDKKYWLDCLKLSPEGNRLATSLLLKCKNIQDVSNFKQLTTYQFNVALPDIKSIPAPAGRRARVVNKVATCKGRPSCVATRQRLILNRKDMNECFLFHLAWELENLHEYMLEWRSGGL